MWLTEIAVFFVLYIEINESHWDEKRISLFITLVLFSFWLCFWEERCFACQLCYSGSFLYCQRSVKSGIYENVCLVFLVHDKSFVMSRRAADISLSGTNIFLYIQHHLYAFVYVSSSQRFDSHRPLSKCCLRSRTTKAGARAEIFLKSSIYPTKFPNDLLKVNCIQKFVC